MENIDWRKKQKQGIQIIEPNMNLSEEYYRNAEETLRIINLTKEAGSNMWLATQKYYAQYFAAYAILMRLGIKSEIHSCTISPIHFLEKSGILSFSFASDLEKDKQLRIDNQYYLKNIPVTIHAKKIIRTFAEHKKVHR